MSEERGKVGYSITRTISDGDYGSYKVSAWAEESFESSLLRDDGLRELQEMCERQLIHDMERIKVSIEYQKLNKGVKNA